MSRPTIADVARLAATSTATVSRVVNDDTRYVRAATRDRVAAAIAELGYRPSALARSLVSRRSKTIGLLVSDIANPFYPEVVRGVEEAAVSRGYSVLLGNTGYSADRALDLARSFADRQADGVILMSSSLSPSVLEELTARQVPVVVVDSPLEGLPAGVHSIAVDYESGIAEAAGHLLALGHRRFAHLAGPIDLPTARRRRDAFLAALAERGIDPNSVAVVEGNLRIDGGRRAIDRILDLPELPTAVFAANDLSAIGLLWAARDRGIRIPDDLSIVGLDDIQLALEVSPPLTTVALPRQDLGQLALAALVEEPPAAALAVATRLVVRGSTGPCPTDRSPRREDR